MEPLWFNVVPMGKPRLTQRDKWKNREVFQRWISYKDFVRLEARRNKYTMGDKISLTFVIPMPKSWSKKKKALMGGQLCKQKPDLDNLIKGVKDILKSNDETVAEYGYMSKEWGVYGGIWVKE